MKTLAEHHLFHFLQNTDNPIYQEQKEKYKEERLKWILAIEEWQNAEEEYWTTPLSEESIKKRFNAKYKYNKARIKWHRAKDKFNLISELYW